MVVNRTFLDPPECGILGHFVYRRQGGAIVERPFEKGGFENETRPPTSDRFIEEQPAGTPCKWALTPTR